MTDPSPASPAAGGRIEAIDIARGVALLAMAVFHFTWDLESQGFLPPGTAAEGGWRLFARAIATSFLFLVGLSLVLAHGSRIRWRPFWIREAQVVAGAAAVTVATYFMTPGSYVFFGILHQIAVASLIGLAFLRLPAWLTAASGAAAIALPWLVQFEALSGTPLVVIGLAAKAPVTNDFVPVFPWTGVVLLGIAAGRILVASGALQRLRALNVRLHPLRWLGLLGRHALLFYLLHQPILFGLVAGYAQVFPPDPGIAFSGICRRDLCTGRDAAECARICGCVRKALDDRALLMPLLERLTTVEEDLVVQGIVSTCVAP